MKQIVLVATLWFFTAAFCLAQSPAIPPAARHDIDAGNHAWVVAMKTGTIAPAADVYAPDALNCSPSGECIRGRKAIAAALRAELAKFGRAQSASVVSKGATQQGPYIIEWGRATMSFASRHGAGGQYLTVWRRQPNGKWEIIRNLDLP